MLRFVIVLLFALCASPAGAQETQMDRAERDMRATMAPAGASVERVGPEEVRVIMPADITFDFNRAEVRYEFVPHLRDLAQTLSRYPGMSVDVVGHADAIGSDGYNLELSRARARAVGEVLRVYGVEYGRVGVSGRGEWEPVASNQTEWGRARNRRVEIRVKALK